VKQAAEAQRAQAEAAAQAAAKQRAQAEAAAQAAAKQRAEAEAAKLAADKQRAEAEATKRAADKQRAEAEAAKLAADKQRAEAEAAKQAVEKQQAEIAAAKTAAERQRAEAAAAKLATERQRAEIAAARTEAERERAEAAAAKTEADRQRAEIAAAKTDAEREHAEAAAAKTEAERQRAQIAAARTEADHLRAEADAAKTAAERQRSEVADAKAEAAAARREAETAKAEAEKMLEDARGQIATLQKKQQDAQALADQARAANAAAQAREEAARDAAAQATHERELAEVAAKQAKDARDRAAASDKAQLVADATAAEARLAKARKMTDDAEAQRKAAEAAALAAKQDLEHTRSTLAGVEQQRATAVAAATDAARKRSEADAAAADAAKQRREAELAKGQAEAARDTAEQQRVAAVDAARAAEKQRTIAEEAAQTAVSAKQNAETSLAKLEKKQQAAERAAADVEARTKAEAKAQAEVVAAKARQDSDATIAAARAEVDRLATERKRAETELADRRKAVAMQQVEATKLETAAAQARDAAEREDARRTKLADERAREEQELAKLKAQKVSAQVAATKPQAGHITNVGFTGDAGTGNVELAAVGDTAVQLGEVSATRVEVIVDHAGLDKKLERTLDVSKFGSPVRRVSTFHDPKTPNRVRIVAELSRPASPIIDHDAAGVHVHFFASSDVAKHTPRTQNVPSPVMGGFGAVSTPITQQSVSQVAPAPNGKKRIYHGATVDFDFKDAPIHDLLRIISDTGHVNIVVPDTVDAKVTVRLKRVPWDEALDVILASHDLGYRREGTIYRVAPRKELDAEDAQEAARREAAQKAEAPRPEVITLNYATAGELKTKLEGMLSPKGKLEVDERTNALIVNDVAGNREQIRALAVGLDTQTPQITIEARIVEARSTFTREFGVQWGGRALAGAAGGNATGLVWPSSIGVVGGNEDTNTIRTGVALPSDFAVNMPAATGTGEGGALGLSLGSVGGNFNINLRLSALEDEGTVRIISAPKITVLNNREAKISQGVSIPISVVSAAGTNTQFVQADLALTVTPHVSQGDCAIAMNLVVTKNEPDFVNVGARGDPTILRKEARTQMLVNDGETTVLGGIYTRNSGLAYKKVPFFGDLPVLGWLFKNRRENDDRTEILVFITPKVTNKASLRCTQ